MENDNEYTETRHRKDARAGGQIIAFIVIAGYVLPLAIAAWRWALQ